ncbi:hypothetical protein ACH5RR_021482 [Cinchona calisaya]|uniref:Uncharacterized protein n=1 Tax=Cinchona calisaya TaxID=153742 RepID=A0ABD2ZHM8_9GENT
MDSTYLHNEIHPCYVLQGRSSSPTWRRMLAVKDLVEPNISVKVWKRDSWVLDLIKYCYPSFDLNWPQHKA